MTGGTISIGLYAVDMLQHWVAPFITNQMLKLEDLEQGSQTVALQMFLDFDSQKSWPADVVLKASGSCRLRTSGGPQFETCLLYTSPSPRD